MGTRSSTTRGINGTGISSVQDLAARIEDLGDNAWHLGGGHGVMFLGLGGEDVADLLQTNTSFI